MSLADFFESTEQSKVNMTKLMWGAVRAKESASAIGLLQEATELDLRPMLPKPVDLSVLSFLPQIKVVLLDGALVENIDSLASLPNIEHLSFIKCGLKRFAPTDRTAFKNLKKLNLRENSIGDLRFLKDLTGLTWLDLGFNAFDDTLPLAKLRALKYLNLQGNRISQLDFIADLQNLTELNLNQNALRNIKILSNLRNLYRVNLGGNPLIDEDLDVLRRSTQIDF